MKNSLNHKFDGELQKVTNFPFSVSKVKHKSQYIYLFVWIGAIKIQSLSGRYLLCQRVTLVFFFLFFMYKGAVVCISEEINVSPCWRKESFRVSCQALVAKLKIL